MIFVGEVKRFKHTTGSPLVFHGGAFAEARQLPLGRPIDAEVDEVSGRFGPDFLCYLIARAHFQTYRPLAGEFERAGITETEYFALIANTDRGAPDVWTHSSSDLADHLPTAEPS